MKYYVDMHSAGLGSGSKKDPFHMIQEAANVAMPGDEVIVAPGIYREAVNPRHGGTSENRIIYRSAVRRKAVITGAERLQGWEKVPGEPDVWTARVKNAIFGGYNPYTTRVFGDWFVGYIVAHTGDIYLNHRSMYEVTERKAVTDPEPSKKSWDKKFSVFIWYTEQDEKKDETVFFANFHGKDPNEEDVEFSVRRNCFLPEEEGLSYITVSGFTIREAATQWAPPTAYQDGMIGPHWSKGWVIEDCDIYESKCSGISLGKYLQPENDNKWLKWKYKDGTQTERDCICQASWEGWDREHVGSHVIRGCKIHDCGQAGIVGHLGGVFSVIEDNHIYNINNKQNLAGAEIGGIKMHAAIDVVIRHNRIHHCTRGLWLDWQAQGTRVTRNLFYDNCLPVDRSGFDPGDLTTLSAEIGEDLFVEVSHGPTLVDNNLLLSDRSLKYASQGGAFVHNLFAGSLTCIGTGTNNGYGEGSVRYTPYHEIHGTKVMGFMSILHGDVRFYNNIFVQMPVSPLFAKLQEALQKPACRDYAMWDTMNFDAGTFVYDAYPTFAEWNSMFEGYCGMGSQTHPERYYTHLPVWAEGNVYLGGARPWKKEKNPVVNASFTPRLQLQEDASGKVHLLTNIYECETGTDGIVNTKTLGMAFEPEEQFENPDGSPITFDSDYFNERRTSETIPGPFANQFEIRRAIW